MKKKESLSFAFEAPEGNRQAFRACLEGLVAQVGPAQAGYSVGNVSAGGVGLHDANGTLRPGDSCEIALLYKGRSLASGLSARVTRRDGDMAGLRFTDLSRRQEERLDKLVLEVQKYLITQRKNRGCNIDEEHET